MELLWHGKTCFTLKTKKTDLVLDPFLDGPARAGLKGDIVLLSREEDPKKILPVEDAKRTFSWPGEYEISETPIRGFQAWDASKSKEEAGAKAHQVTVFKIEAEGFRICHLGSLGHKLTTELIEQIGDIDILLVPIGGKDTEGHSALDAKKAHEVIEEVDPRVVIPMYSDASDLEAFAKVVGMRSHQPIEKYTVASKSALPQDHTEYVVLEPVK